MSGWYRYRYRDEERTGTVRGTVYYNFNPQEDATVEIQALGRSTLSAQGGSYEFLNVPAGDVTVYAEKMIVFLFWGEANGEVVKSDVTELDIDLTES